MTDETERTGAEELRLLVSNLNATSEGFNDRFSIDQLIRIHYALQASEWDFLPDLWSARQVREALRGIPPKWDDQERPAYTSKRTKAAR